MGGAISAVVLTAATASAGVRTELPAPEALPGNVVAVVSHLPTELGTVTRRELRHALAISAAAAGLDSIPRPGAEAYEKLEVRATGELVDSAWLYGQGAAMGIVVTAAEIARERELIKEQNFESDAEWRRFLRESRFTRRDVNERVELQIISTRIQQRVVAGALSNAERREAFREFVAAYQQRWKARTVCAPEYTIERCSNG